MRLHIKYIYWIPLILSVVHPAYGQTSNLFSFSGNIGLFYDFYDHSTENYQTFRPRYPNNLGRLSAHATISAGRYFSMPFGIDFSAGQATYHLPTLPEERFVDYVRNPLNNIHINPQYKWVQAWAGTQTPNFSSLSTGDIPIFGVGLAMNPGKFIFAAHYGTSQLGINPDPTANIAGTYRQRMLASRIGMGTEDGTKFVLNFVHIKDDIFSVDQRPAGLQPREGMVLSPLLQIRLSPTLTFSTETAGSVFTRDLLGPAMVIDNDITPYMEDFIGINGSTNTDFSNISSIDWQSDNAGFGLEVRYLGPGYEAIGYRAMERDLIDYNLRTNLAFFQRRIMLNGSAGIRTNNLRGTTAESTNRFIANANLYAQITEQLSVNTSFANFGFRNNVLFDTLKVEMIQNMFSISPSYQINGQNITHMINAGVSMQYFDEFNVFEGTFVSTQSQNYTGNYMLVFNNIPLNLGLLGMYLENTTPTTSLTLYNIRLMARYRFLDNKLSPALNLSYMGIEYAGQTPDARLQMQLRTTYKVTSDMELQLGYTLSNHTYGSTRPGAVTTEHRLQLAVRQRF